MLVTSLSVIIIIIICGLIVLVIPKINDTKTKVALSLSHLAELPKITTNLQVGNNKDSSSKIIYLKFTASKEDINNFINNSDGLKNSKPNSFNYEEWKHQYDYIFKEFSWFNPKSNSGIIYEIHEDENRNNGILIVDNSINTVYLRIEHK